MVSFVHSFILSFILHKTSKEFCCSRGMRLGACLYSSNFFSFKIEGIPQHVSLEKLYWSHCGLFIVPWKEHECINGWTIFRRQKLHVYSFSYNFIVRFNSTIAVLPSAFVFVSVGSRWPYIFGSLFSSLQICTGLSGCHCWACVQTHSYSRVQVDCLLPVRCCECGLTDKWHHWVLAETQQDWCPRWNNSVYQGKAILLALEIHLFLLRNSFPAASA